MSEHWEGCEEVHWDCKIDRLQDENRRIRVELHTLRFKEYQEQRFVWWIWNVYSRNVNDLILSIMGATTYDTEGEAKEGKYALPKHCFDLMKRIDEYTEHIYDGTYLDIEVSTENKTVPENKPEYTEPSNNDGSATQNVCSWIQEDDPEINLWRTSCHNTFYIDADKPSDNHMKYCCYCGKEIAEGYVPANADIPVEISENELGAQEAERKTFCPNCEAETPCTHEAELYVCDICGEDFAKYIVSRNCSVSDVSMTQDVLTSIKTPSSIENTNPDYYNPDYQSPWISITSGRLPEKFQECIVLDKRRHVHNWIHDDALLPLFAQYTHWMPIPPLPEEERC